MKGPAAASYEMLGRITDFEDIAEWTGIHHEKLDGLRYPRGLKADALSFEDCLMACLDIYQLLTEERPYKKKITYFQSIDIMRSMASYGKIDAGIVEDIAAAFVSNQDKGKSETETEDASQIKELRCEVYGFVFKGKEAPDHCPVCDSLKEIAYRNQECSKSHSFLLRHACCKIGRRKRKYSFKDIYVTDNETGIRSFFKTLIAAEAARQDYHQ